MSRHLICLITDRRRLSPGASSTEVLDRVVAQVGAAGRAGIDFIQVRERGLEAGDLAKLVGRCARELRATDAKLIVNDRVDVAMAAGAHGVHLRGDGIDAVRARQLVPHGFIVGRSVHGVEETRAAARDGGLDYLILGTLFATPSKDPPHRLTTLTGLAGACAMTTIPILAIGGINLRRAEDVVRTGAAGVAAIGMFVPAQGEPLEKHVRARVVELRRLFDTCGAVP